MENNQKFLNVNIIGVGTYLPDNKVDNEYYINHFKELKGIDITGALESIGRDYRHISTDLDETVITMSTEAALIALKESNTNPEELDMVVFSTDSPEFTTPTNAIKLVNAIGAKNAKLVYDINANCLGMTLGLDQVSRTMKTNKRFKKALIVGSVLISSIARKDDFLTYATFGDSASAVILEAVEESYKRGVIDSVSYTDSDQHATSQSPINGFSRYLRTDVTDKEELKWFSYPVESANYPSIWSDMIKDLLSEHQKTQFDIDFFALPQFTEPLITDTLKALDIENIEEHYNFVSRNIGYTGTSCVIFSIKDALNKGKVKEGSNVIFVGSGVGFSTMALYYKF